MIKYTCPICDRHFYDTVSWPSVRTTPWTDDCACCDANLCSYHAISEYNKIPNRPSDDLLKEKAEKIAKEKDIETNNKIENIKHKFNQLERNAGLCLQIKEYFGWSFETFEEFEKIMEEYKNGNI